MAMFMKALLTSNLGEKVEITPPMGAGEPHRVTTLIIGYDR
jgi:hypothetical protein